MTPARASAPRFAGAAVFGTGEGLSVAGRGCLTRVTPQVLALLEVRRPDDPNDKVWFSFPAVSERGQPVRVVGQAEAAFDFRMRKGHAGALVAASAEEIEALGFQFALYAVSNLHKRLFEERVDRATGQVRLDGAQALLERLPIDAGAETLSADPSRLTRIRAPSNWQEYLSRAELFSFIVGRVMREDGAKRGFVLFESEDRANDLVLRAEDLRQWRLDLYGRLADDAREARRALNAAKEENAGLGRRNAQLENHLQELSGRANAQRTAAEDQVRAFEALRAEFAELNTNRRQWMQRAEELESYARKMKRRVDNLENENRAMRRQKGLPPPDRHDVDVPWPQQPAPPVVHPRRSRADPGEGEHALPGLLMAVIILAVVVLFAVISLFGMADKLFASDGPHHKPPETVDVNDVPPTQIDTPTRGYTQVTDPGAQGEANRGAPAPASSCAEDAAQAAVRLSAVNDACGDYRNTDRDDPDFAGKRDACVAAMRSAHGQSSAVSACAVSKGCDENAFATPGGARGSYKPDEWEAYRQGLSCLGQ